MSASALRSQAPAANNRRCAQCGLINFAAAEACRRCKSPLDAVAVSELEPEEKERSASSVLLRRLLWLAGMIVLVVFLCSRSLLLTSEPITNDQRMMVIQAIKVLEQ